MIDIEYKENLDEQLYNILGYEFDNLPHKML